MDEIKFFKTPGTKTSTVLMLGIGGVKNYWEIPDSAKLENPGKALAFELSPETIMRDGELEICEEGELRVDYCKKKKIKFRPTGMKNLSGDYVLYIPSWGLHTERKIWVFISPGIK